MDGIFGKSKFEVLPPSKIVSEQTIAVFENFTFGRMFCANGMIIYTTMNCHGYKFEQLSWAPHSGRWEHESE